MTDFHCKYCGGTEKHDRRVCRMKARWQDPKFRARQAAGTRAELAKRWQDPWFRERSATVMRRNWQDPEFRARTAAGVKAKHRDPEFRARWLEGVRATHRAPEFRDGPRKPIEVCNTVRETALANRGRASAAEIAEAIGTTRNAIIGHWYRARHSGEIE